MARYFKHDLNFLGHRRIFFAISLVLIVVSVLAIGIRGINLGIEFQGGTNITFTNTGELSIEDMRAACNKANLENPIIQTADSGATRGFIIRTSETDPNVAAATALEISKTLNLPETDYEVQTIGPDWGTSVMQTSLMAFIIAIIVIIIYISIRFEWKMSLTAIIGLIHDLTIVVGIYALFGLEVTPNVIAAILTIMGYSLYDTVVSFHRINENASPNMHHSYITVANHSVNQVFARTINTTLTSLIPVLAMLFFGGETLKDFALAMAIGLVLGSYSSFGIAVPIFSLWKSRELVYANLAVKYGEGIGDFTGEQLPDILKGENLPESVTRKVRQADRKAPTPAKGADDGPSRAEKRQAKKEGKERKKASKDEAKARAAAREERARAREEARKQAKKDAAAAEASAETAADEAEDAATEVLVETTEAEFVETITAGPEFSETVAVADEVEELEEAVTEALEEEPVVEEAPADEAPSEEEPPAEEEPAE